MTYRIIIVVAEKESRDSKWTPLHFAACYQPYRKEEDGVEEEEDGVEEEAVMGDEEEEREERPYSPPRERTCSRSHEQPRSDSHPQPDSPPQPESPPPSPPQPAHTMATSQTAVRYLIKECKVNVRSSYLLTGVPTCTYMQKYEGF